MPQIRSIGLASTSTRRAVPSRYARSASSCPNLATLPATTSSNRPVTQRSSSKPSTWRPSALASAGVRAARTRGTIRSSPNIRALPAIIQCSAVGYSTPSTTNGDGHHWLSAPGPTCPSCCGRCPQNSRYSGCAPAATRAVSSSRVRVSAGPAGMVVVMAPCCHPARTLFQWFGRSYRFGGCLVLSGGFDREAAFGGCGGKARVVGDEGAERVLHVFRARHLPLRVISMRSPAATRSTGSLACC